MKLSEIVKDLISALNETLKREEEIWQSNGSFITNPSKNTIRWHNKQEREKWLESVNKRIKQAEYFLSTLHEND